MQNKIKPIAIYLPQFHPIPENDAWWGKGFTEWTNVVKARSRFEGHYQPHLPADLGFYDLRLEEARLAQEQLAKSYGIHGFCYYHYWFNGKRVLHEPLDRKMQNTKEDLPFMMCWANENWTKTWDGADHHVLLHQEYSFEDDLEHIQHLITYFKDDRYIKVNGKPVFVIYRPRLFQDIKQTIALWREEVKKAGFPDLYIGFAQNNEHSFLPKEKGFDFGIQFQPNFGTKQTPIPFGISKLKTHTIKFKRLLGYKVKKIFGFNYDKCNHYFDYWAYAKTQIELDFRPNIYPGITPMWDNSARRNENPFIFHNSTPTKYKKWLTHIKKKYPWDTLPENFLFINAWNEWAEGNHLEPCQKWGKQYLEVTKNVLDNK
jgi:lipopolysaccharide biosynthesis protein